MDLVNFIDNAFKNSPIQEDTPEMWGMLGIVVVVHLALIAVIWRCCPRPNPRDPKFSIFKEDSAAPEPMGATSSNIATAASVASLRRR